MSADLVPNFYMYVAWAAALGALALWLSWSLNLGFLRGTLAVLCRIGWLAPIFLSFFPETVSEQLPRTMTLTPVHILLDDSLSMQGDGKGDGAAPMRAAQALIDNVTTECARLGCMPKVTRLSEQDDDVAAGFTPLSSMLDSWIYKVGQDPWMLVTDGGDSKPTEHWASTLKNAGKAEGRSTPRALIVGFQPKERRNIWIKDHDVAPFSFEDKPLVIDVNLKRSDTEDDERVQVQVLTGETALATVNAAFKKGETDAALTVTIPPLPRGQHLLQIRALPVAGEAALWDNTVYAQIEVLPNTVGVLHLLGSPSWDGRFLRRYLKAEPKYDLISFFILRDPWDSQQVNERELSLIPFPVERLFREELPNFRVVVIQNFTLFQFLLPEYQNNLVKFVQDGGGLLFIGGPRALTPADLSSSPLRQVLPFEVEGDDQGTGMGGMGGIPGMPGMGFGGNMPGFDEDDADEGSAPSTAVSATGPAYDPDLAFRVEMAKPEPEKRALANVYEDWEALAAPLTEWRTAKGIHHMERVKFKKDTTTVLLNARAGKTTIPLAVASYPGKGRAIWLFSDSFERLAMSPAAGASRQVYNRFMTGAMTWLMRQDLRKPLVAKGLTLSGGRRRAASFRVTLQGPAARYYQPSAEWKLTACGGVVPPEKLLVAKHGDGEFELSGPLPVILAGGERCTVEIEGVHPAFGSVKASITGVYPETYKDEEMDAAPQKLEALATLTGATLSLPPTDALESARVWLEGATGQDGVALPSRFKTLRNFYWILDKAWFWLLLLLLPLEVVVRKWDQLVGGGRAVTQDDDAEPNASVPIS